MMSARFPVVSPPGGIPNRNGRIVDRVVDGGYYENFFGATTASELATELKKTYGMDARIILINNEPKIPQLDCRIAAARESDLQYSEAPWFPSFSAPLQALFRTRNARGSHAASGLCQSINSQVDFITVSKDSHDPNKELSMSWWLSKHVQKRLDEQLDHPINLETLERISDVCWSSAGRCTNDGPSPE